MNLYTTALPEDGLVHLRGKAIADFLQGQLTCDMRKLTPEIGVAGAFCSAKGRVISDVFVVELGANHCALRLKQELAEDVAAALGRYAQFSRISVEVAPEDSVFGLYAQAGTLPSETPQLPADASSMRLWENAVLLCRAPGLWEFFDSDTDANAASTFDDFIHATLKDQTRIGTSEHWQAALLGTGHYSVKRGETEKFTPQGLNYDRLGMVSFDKGCYTGQEVVARLHYKGKSKTRIQSYAVAATDSAAAGSDPAVVLQEPNSGADAGEVKAKYRDSAGRLIVAASIVDAHIGSELVMQNSGARLTPCLESGGD